MPSTLMEFYLFFRLCQARMTKHFLKFSLDLLLDIYYSQFGLLILNGITASRLDL